MLPVVAGQDKKRRMVFGKRSYIHLRDVLDAKIGSPSMLSSFSWKSRFTSGGFSTEFLPSSLAHCIQTLQQDVPDTSTSTSISHPLEERIPRASRDCINRAYLDGLWRRIRRDEIDRLLLGSVHASMYSHLSPPKSVPVPTRLLPARSMHRHVKDVQALYKLELLEALPGLDVWYL